MQPRLLWMQLFMQASAHWWLLLDAAAMAAR
jgi:hypothetical protein